MLEKTIFINGDENYTEWRLVPVAFLLYLLRSEVEHCILVDTITVHINFTMLYQSPVTLHGHCKTRVGNCWVLYDDRFLSLFEMLQITAILPLRTLWFFQGHISMGCSVICLLILSVSRVFPWRNESFSGSDCLQVESFETRLLNTRMEILRSCRKF